MPFDFRVKATGKVTQTWVAFNIPFTTRMVRFAIYTYKNPEVITTGISSRCKDGRHVLFLDYDKQEFKQVVEEVRYIQNTFKLSTAYIFETEKNSNHHVIFLDKKSLLDQFKILQETNCDWGYIQSVKMSKGREWILRVTEKGNRKCPKYIAKLGSKHDNNEISTAHKQFIEIYYGVETDKYKKEDNISELPVIDYSTGNRVK